MKQPKIDSAFINQANRLYNFLAGYPEIWFTASQINSHLQLGKDANREVRAYRDYLIRTNARNFIVSGQRGYAYSLNPDNYRLSALRNSAKAKRTQENADITGNQERLLKKLSLQ
ncbi:hypothetical protein [Oenococcus sicerae]|uniref:hypothetical protein n=1 Tax=Oenococcus sicerae TaxID=2203724 RepID=UPI0039EC7E6F